MIERRGAREKREEGGTEGGKPYEFKLTRKFENSETERKFALARWPLLLRIIILF